MFLISSRDCMTLRYQGRLTGSVDGNERTRERGSEEVRRDSTRCGWYHSWYVIVIMISARESDLLATVCLGCTWLREVITQAAAFQAQAASPLGVATRIYLSSIHYTQCGAVHYLQKRRASFFLCKKKNGQL